MKQLATVKVWQLLKMNRASQLKFIKSNLKDKEFMELLYLGYHTSIGFRFEVEEIVPRPQAPLDHHKEFFRLAMGLVRDQFNVDKRTQLKSFIENTDPLSNYIYAKIVNKRI